MFWGAVITAFAFDMYYRMPIYENEFKIDSLAYKDENKCSDYSSATLVGVWEGEKYYGNKNTTQKWTNVRKVDGTYRIDFQMTTDGETSESSEEGYWSYSGCLYSVIVKKIDDENVLYEEVYRVHEITDSRMKYTNFRTGESFEQFRKAIE